MSYELRFWINWGCGSKIVVSISAGTFGTADENPQDVKVGLSTGYPQGKKVYRSTLADYLV